nr:hypothetical protein [Tanacetum cinerariifolium]
EGREEEDKIRSLETRSKSWNGGLSKKLMLKKNKMKKVMVVMKKRLVEKENRNWDEMIHHHFYQSWHQVEVMRKDDFEWQRRSKHLTHEVSSFMI